MSNINSANNDEVKITINLPDKTLTHKIIIFWAITVIANSLFGSVMYISMSKSDYPGIAGMASAIISCIAIYSMAEIYLRQKNKNQLVLELRISACIRIVVQPISDFLIGFLAIYLANNALKTIYSLLNFKYESFLNNQPVGFISTYTTTMIHAFLATLMVACILCIVKLLIYLYKRLSTQP